MVAILRCSVKSRFKNGREVFREKGSEGRERCADDTDGELDGGPHCRSGVIPGDVFGDGNEVDVVEAENGRYARARVLVSRAYRRTGKEGSTYKPPRPRMSIKVIFSRVRRIILRRMKAGRMINQMSAAILMPAFANQSAGLLIHVPLILSSQNFGTGLHVQMLVRSA